VVFSSFRHGGPLQGGLYVLALAALVLTAACTSGPPPPEEDPLQRILDKRAAKEQYMREDPESPVPPEKRDVLLPLRYYPPDTSYIVPAALNVSPDRPVFEMPTSIGTIRKMERVGNLEFQLQGHTLTLGAFVEAGTRQIQSLFVPFADATTGKETYPAGRYLDIEPTASGLYTIDFNDAYNPSCAYSEKYECPFPPPSNRLSIAIPVGEKKPGV
jgi:uncharacterized protein (DUF1684 family)